MKYEKGYIIPGTHKEEPMPLIAFTDLFTLYFDVISGEIDFVKQDNCSEPVKTVLSSSTGKEE